MLQIALNVSLLMDFFNSSPLGSLGLPQLQMKDFVLVDKYWVKLADLGDVSMEEKSCSWRSDCLLQGSDIGKWLLRDGFNKDTLFSIQTLLCAFINFCKYIFITHHSFFDLSLYIGL